MPAGSLVALRSSFALLLASSCAHAAATGRSAGTVYESAGGDRIVITRNSITLGGVSYPLADCSDASSVCASSDVGFHVSFPSACLSGTWFPAAGPMRWTSGFPHSEGGRYINRGRSIFLYDWDAKYGLVSFVYDPAKDFAALPPDYTHDGPTVYYRKSGPALFACAPARSHRG
jgi:hypothetical protein